MRRAFVLPLLLVIFLCGDRAHASAFTDVPDGHPLVPAVIDGLRGGYVTLDASRQFFPDRPITRMEFSRMLARALWEPEEIKGCVTATRSRALWQDLELSDADYEAPYGDALCALQRADVFGGFADHTFHPHEGVTFAEAARSLALGFRLTKLSIPVLSAEQWRLLMPYAKHLSRKRVIPTSIRGYGYPVTRSEALTMIYRLRNPRVTSRLTITEYQLASHVSDSVSWKEWLKYGMSIQYRSSWHEPHVVLRGASDPWFPNDHSLKQIQIGEQQHCRGFGICAGQDILIDLFPESDGPGILTLLEQTPGIRILQRYARETTKYFYYRELGNCAGDPDGSSEGVLALGPHYTYRLLAPCIERTEELYPHWLRLLRSFFVYPASDLRAWEQ